MACRAWREYPCERLQLYLVIDKQYLSDRPIISIGCDCHPAHVLDALYIRNKSYPFDWLNTTAFSGIDYVNYNIQDAFCNYLLNLRKNHRGHIVSGHYPNSEFYHYSDLIENKEMQNTLRRRAKRFLSYYNELDCNFLYSITSKGLTTRKEASFFLESIKHFHEANKSANRNHKLLIYIRYDRSFLENKKYCESIIKEVSNYERTKIAKFILNRKRFGQWGNKYNYPQLLRLLGVNLKLAMPKIYIKINNRQLRKRLRQ